MDKDKLEFSKQPERRFQTNTTLELRDVDGTTGERRVEGYAAVFNSETDIGGFSEVIAPTAFEGRLNDPVVAVFNHNQLQPLAKVGAGLELTVDEHGLRYSFPIPDTTAGRDLVELMERGIVRDASFAFMLGPDGDTWEKRDGKTDLRTIERVARLVDVSVVTVGAYSDATSVLRSYDAFSGPKNDVCASCGCGGHENKETPQDGPETAPSDKIQTHGAKVRSAVLKHRIKQIRKKQS
jgi:HK97 family phage prohead protease